jgi:IclR family mhp operon transcriptional activator
MQPKPIRSFARGLAVLEALNSQGNATALALSRTTGVPRATVYRLLRTLEDGGYVGRGHADDLFYPLLKTRRLSGGFENEHWITEIGGAALQALTERISWPCDISTLDGLKMTIRDTTHQTAPLSIDRNMVGRRLPILASAAGLAYIAFAPTHEQATLLELLARSDDQEDAPARDPVRAGRLIAAIRQQGYGFRQGGDIWPHTGAIALPIRAGDRLIGCISTIWMARVIDLAEGVRRCLEPLRETRALIEERLSGTFSSASPISARSAIRSSGTRRSLPAAQS